MNNSPDRYHQSNDTPKTQPNTPQNKEDLDRKFGGFTLSKIDNEAKRVLEEIAKMQTIHDPENKNGLYIQANEGMIIDMGKTLSQAMLIDGNATSMKLIKSESHPIQKHTFHISYDYNGIKGHQEIVIKEKNNPKNNAANPNQNNETLSEKLHFPDELNQFITNRIDLNGGVAKIQFKEGTKITMEQSSDGKKPAIPESPTGNDTFDFDEYTKNIEYIGVDKTSKPQRHHFKMTEKNGVTQNFSLINESIESNEKSPQLPKELENFINTKTINNDGSMQLQLHKSTVLRAQPSSDGLDPGFEGVMDNLSLTFSTKTEKIEYIGFDKKDPEKHHFKIINKDKSTQLFSLRQFNIQWTLQGSDSTHIDHNTKPNTENQAPNRNSTEQRAEPKPNQQNNEIRGLNEEILDLHGKMALKLLNIRLDVTKNEGEKAGITLKTKESIIMSVGGVEMSQYTLQGDIKEIIHKGSRTTPLEASFAITYMKDGREHQTEIKTIKKRDNENRGSNTNPNRNNSEQRAESKPNQQNNEIQKPNENQWLNVEALDENSKKSLEALIKQINVTKNEGEKTGITLKAKENIIMSVGEVEMSQHTFHGDIKKIDYKGNRGIPVEKQFTITYMENGQERQVVINTLVKQDADPKPEQQNNSNANEVPKPDETLGFDEKILNENTKETLKKYLDITNTNDKNGKPMLILKTKKAAEGKGGTAIKIGGIEHTEYILQGNIKSIVARQLARGLSADQYFDVTFINNNGQEEQLQFKAYNTFR